MRCISALLLLGASAAQAQINPHVVLRITDSAGRPVPFVNLVRGSSTSLIADDSGRLVFTPGKSAQQIELRRLGYQPLKFALAVNGDTTIAVIMATAPRLLPELRVVASHSDRLLRTGLYERIRDVENGLIVGTFVTAEEIEMRKPIKITQMLDKAPGVTVYNGVPMASANNCPMTTYLDGSRIDFGGSAGGGMAEGAPGAIHSMMTAMTRSGQGTGRVNEYRDTMNGMINPNEVAAIEIYPLPGSVPAMYQHLNGTCGVIAIWTK